MERDFGSINLKIFFDESGKNQTKPHLMGGLAIPESYYNSPKVLALNELIRKKEIHWTAYGGDSTERKIIWKIILTLLEHQYLLKMNVISYNQSKIEEISKKIKNVYENIADQTIYMKFPERIIYGLLRKYGSHVHLNTQIYIEHDTTYQNKNYDLRNQLFEQLNIQSVYRGEHFTIQESNYYSKQEEVGIESIDILLGMVRTIIRNDSPTSKRIREKNNLVMKLLLNEKFYRFITQIKYFEWSNSPELIEVDFENYVHIFMSSNQTFE
ncbi:hypothetical protein P4571_18595 [Niallia alba]|uniref:hypothetical protein n=1 Tax=Niallia alba TaxID=2729105 RepID=UPI002E1F9A4B|nr:hypothetical protein [Niallia alba]